LCVIVYKPIGAVLPRKNVEIAFDNNPHGWGLAWWRPRVLSAPGRKASPGQWLYAHGMDLPSLMASYDAYITMEQPALLHTRIASCGDIDPMNLHPFVMEAHGGLLMHNGTLAVPPVRAKGTDSEGLAAFLNSIPNLAALLQDPHWVATLSGLISPSKVVLASYSPSGSPVVSIIGEHRGDWKNGLWASNSTAFNEYVPTKFKPLREIGKKPYQGKFDTYWDSEKQKMVPFAQLGEESVERLMGGTFPGLRVADEPSSAQEAATVFTQEAQTKQEPTIKQLIAEAAAEADAAADAHDEAVHPSLAELRMIAAAEACEDAYFVCEGIPEDNGTIRHLAISAVRHADSFEALQTLSVDYSNVAALALRQLGYGEEIKDAKLSK
jgi:hypothetical protein